MTAPARLLVAVLRARRWKIVSGARGIVAAGAALSLACGGPGPLPARLPPSLDVDGVPVAVSSSAPWSSGADLPARLSRIIGAGARHWGGTAAGLAGWQLQLVDGPVPCGADPGDRLSGHLDGCTDHGARIMTVSGADWFDPATGESADATCLEQLPVVHEVGHALIGDHDHRDPRWREWSDVLAALSPACPGLDTSVWAGLPHDQR